MSVKADILRENKRLKTVRRRNKWKREYNFNTKTLPNRSPIYDTDTQSIKDFKHVLMAWIKKLRIRRENKQ